ncbi:AP endonuclease [Bacillus obstructivus]|nr:AP endonuclease [Bacillus obstructivus]
MKVNLGIRAHDIDKQSPQELAAAISEKGFTAIQLALSKSFPNINTSLGSLSPGFAHYIRNAFSNHKIQISVLGCYINMIHPDNKERRKALDRFKEHIRYARDFGCSIIATETGNINPKMGYTEENFKEEPFLEVVKSVKELVEEAEKFGVIVGIEAGINHPVYSSILMKRLLNCVDSNNLQVIFDPVNLLFPNTFDQQEEIFEEAIELFGDRIAIVHAKDFIIKNDRIETVPVGQGLLNYDVVMKLIKRTKPFIHFLMEATKEPHIDDSIAFLQKKYEQA